MPFAPSVEVHLTSAELVRAARSGDRSAFGALYQQYAPMVHGIALAHLPPSDADDLVQDVFMRALEELTSLRSAEAFGGWIAAIARRSAADVHRRRREVSSDKEEAGGLRPDGEAFATLAVLKTLPKAYRETLVLRLVEGMTGPEIAARTGLRPDSVRVNLCRGMQLLRKALGGRQRP